MKFRLIPPDKLPLVWHHIAPLLDKAVSLSPQKIVIQDVLNAALHGVYFIWVAVDEEKGEFVGVVTTRILTYPRCRALAMDFIGGSRMKEWLPEAQKAVEEHGKRNGCKFLEGYGRRAWSRFLEPLGWKQAYITYHKDI